MKNVLDFANRLCVAYARSVVEAEFILIEELTGWPIDRSAAEATFAWCRKDLNGLKASCYWPPALAELVEVQVSAALEAA